MTTNNNNNNSRPPVSSNLDSDSSVDRDGRRDRQDYRQSNPPDVIDETLSKTYSNVKTSTFDESNFEYYLAADSSPSLAKHQHPSPQPVPVQQAPNSQQNYQFSHYRSSQQHSNHHSPTTSHHSRSREPQHQHHSHLASSDNNKQPHGGLIASTSRQASSVTAASAAAASVNVNELESLISNLIDIKLQEKTSGLKTG